MNGVSCVKNEIHNVLAQLRLFKSGGSTHARTSTPRRFKALLETLNTLESGNAGSATLDGDQLAHLEPLVFLHPFLALISEETDTSLILTGMLVFQNRNS